MPEADGNSEANNSYRYKSYLKAVGAITIQILHRRRPRGGEDLVRV